MNISSISGSNLLVVRSREVVRGLLTYMRVQCLTPYKSEDGFAKKIVATLSK